MRKKLAIYGHPTRGKEVIELLEMMGGNNIHYLPGDNSYAYYVIEGCQNEIRAGEYIFGNEDMYFFTLEEFLGKHPYKIGDKVNSPCRGCIKTITSMKWDVCLNTVSYKLDDKIYTTIEQLKVVNDLPYKETDDVELSNDKCERTHEDVIFDSIIWHLRNSVNNGKQNLSGGECEDYFREVVKKNNENKMKGVLAELLEHIKTTSKEDLEREFEEIKEWSNVGPTIEEFKAFCECVNKKPKYPKTYVECCELLSLGEDGRLYTKGYKASLIQNLHKLYICRNAYWKIAGEQMGLGESWEPDWNEATAKYTIVVIENKLEKRYALTQNYILAFPTEEMRDAFYENFKELIEQCKELL